MNKGKSFIIRLGLALAVILIAFLISRFFLKNNNNSTDTVVEQSVDTAGS